MGKTLNSFIADLNERNMVSLMVKCFFRLHKLGYSLEDIVYAIKVHSGLFVEETNDDEDA